MPAKASALSASWGSPQPRPPRSRDLPDVRPGANVLDNPASLGDASSRLSGAGRKSVMLVPRSPHARNRAVLAATALILVGAMVSGQPAAVASAPASGLADAAAMADDG